MMTERVEKFKLDLSCDQDPPVGTRHECKCTHLVKLSQHFYIDLYLPVGIWKKTFEPMLRFEPMLVQSLKN